MKSPVRPSTSSGLPKARAVSTGVSSRPTVPANRPGVLQLVKRQAIGPVAAFTPWNFPAITPARKLSAALAAGCSVILKPGEESPATALALARALDDAGLPKGVLQVVFGVPDQVSSQLIASPIIRKVTFTGSVPIGRECVKTPPRTLAMISEDFIAGIAHEALYSR